MVSPTSALNSPTGVLSVDQLTALDAAVGPLNPDQLIWASGYVAGLAAALRPSQTTVGPTQLETTSTANVPELAIVYGSQTGHSEAIAETLHQSAQQAGFATKLLNMSDLSARKLAKERWVALVVSTHGEGDPPDDAIMLLEQLGKPRAPSFTDTQFSVLALGDSSYAKFCQTGKDFEAALVSLGAKTIAPIVECDVDYQTSAAEWRERVLTDYASLVSADSTRPALHVVPAAQTQLTEGVATVVANQRITGDRSSKVVHHLELAFDTPLDYQPGDSVGLKVANPDIVVEALLTAAGFDGNTPIVIDGSEVALFDALKTQFEVTRISGPLLEAYARLDGVQGLSKLLEDSESKGALISSGHIADIITRFPHTASAQTFVDCLRPLQHRLYSIASSPMETEDEIHITVAEVNFDIEGSTRQGAVSRTLIHDLEEGDEFRAFIEPNTRFRLPPSPDTDVIMIGPGTGVAPFRSFVQHRAAEEATGRHWLFFGDRTFSEDFLYQAEWQRQLREGALDHIDLAFSRDQAEKVYVQDRLRSRAEQLLEWIDGGAAIYVCGDASAMAPDVHAALVEILASRHDGDLEAGAADLEALRRERRYLRDVY